MDYRYHIDPETDSPHIERHGVTEAEVEYLLRHPGEDRASRDGSRQALGQTASGRYLRVIYVPDEEGDGIFVVTAYDLKGRPLQAYKRRKAGVHGPTRTPLVRIVEADGNVVELAATTAKGDLRVITGMTKEGDTLILRGMHIDGPGAGSVGPRELRNLATDLGRQQGAKQVTIYGGTRTTGANPGHTPRPITFPVGD